MSEPAPRRIIILGCTGSIGCNVLEVVAHLHAGTGHRFEVVGLAAGSNVAKLLEQARSTGVKHVAVARPDDAGALSAVNGAVLQGPESALELVDAVGRPGDLVVGAMVGAAGIPATLRAIELGCDVALANKETLVAAGEIVMPAVRAAGVKLLPIDSEHSAVFQCLLAGRTIEEVRRLVITASGGPFRTWTKQRIETATVDEALAHPTWSMGRKITIDSASLMNKALEVVEAHWLFDLPSSKIDAIVHPQSIVHSFVEFIDGSVIAQLGPPDMRTPIQYTLTWPDRADGCSRTMDWAALSRLDFEPVDETRFGAIRLAREVIDAGGSAGAVFNAANEAAVEAFLDRRIPFGRVETLVREALESVPSRPVHTMTDVLAADEAARAHVRSRAATAVGSA